MIETDIILKKEMYDTLLKNNTYIPVEEDLLKFLDDILNLRTMSSSDGRYDNAYDDTSKHIVYNDDWTLEYIFFERFPSFLKEEKVFISFIEHLISPKYRSDNDEINRLEFILNPILKKAGKILVLDSYDNNGKKVLTIDSYTSQSDITSKIIKNKIPIYVVENEEDTSIIPQQFPHFILSETYWDDYGLRAKFKVHLRKNANDITSFDEIKILKKGIKEEDFTSEFGGNSKCRIAKKLPKKFFQLPEDFCSLGQNGLYYNTLKNEFNDEEFKSILLAFRDIAFFDKIYNDFEHESYFNSSLLRADNVEKLSRIIKYKIYGYDLTKLYSFSYNFKPKFNNSNEIKIELDFSNNDGVFSNRIKCFIGKNGTSKTQFVSSLPLSIAEKDLSLFSPQMPLFSKIIAISYSVFDRFKIPKENEEFNYIYCGLKNNEGTVLSEDLLFFRFYNSFKKIIKLGDNKFDIWRKYVSDILNVNVFENNIDEHKSEKELKEIIIKLSSGQSIMIYIMTELIANIRLNSLLIYDEPETHLHPNAISSLIKTIIKLSEEFDSFCLIATHSPLIVRELFSKDVIILEKEENNLSVRQPSIETFAENLTVITEEIFNNRDIEKNYKKVIKNIIDELNLQDFEEIIATLQKKNIDLSLNARLYLKVFLDEKYSS